MKKLNVSKNLTRSLTLTLLTTVLLVSNTGVAKTLRNHTIFDKHGKRIARAINCYHKKSDGEHPELVCSHIHYLLSGFVIPWDNVGVDMRAEGEKAPQFVNEIGTVYTTHTNEKGETTNHLLTFCEGTCRTKKIKEKIGQPLFAWRK